MHLKFLFVLPVQFHHAGSAVFRVIGRDQTKHQIQVIFIVMLADFFQLLQCLPELLLVDLQRLADLNLFIGVRRSPSSIINFSS